MVEAEQEQLVVGVQQVQEAQQVQQEALDIRGQEVIPGLEALQVIEDL